MLRNTKQTWGALSRLLHWGVAGIILFQLVMGVWMSKFVQDALEQFALVQIHKSWGFVVFVLAGLRLVWRVMNPTPSHPAHMSRLSRLFADLGHIGLYLFMFILPLSGWLMSSASLLQDRFGIKNKVFGLFELYDPFVPGDEALANFFAAIHFYAAIGLTGLILGHGAAALFHHFYHKDDILTRMTFGRLKLKK